MRIFFKIYYFFVLIKVSSHKYLIEYVVALIVSGLLQ